MACGEKNEKKGKSEKMPKDGCGGKKTPKKGK
jgi:hypothetical protein